MILNESLCTCCFIIGNPAHIHLGKFLISIYSQEISLNGRLIRFHDSPNFNTQEAIKLRSYFFIILEILKANFVQLWLHQLDSKILLISVTQ